MASRNGVSGMAVVAVFSGAILAYSGVKGKGVGAGIRALIAGQNPSTLPTTQGISIANIPPGVTYTGEHSGGVPVVSGSDNQRSIANFLINDLRLSRAGAAAVLGNFQVESGLSPVAYNPTENAHGLAQWEGPRWTLLQVYAQSVGGSPNDLSVQLGFLKQELTTSYSGVLSQLWTATDPSAAAAVFDSQYEGSSGSTRAERIGLSQRFYLLLHSLVS